MNRTEEQIKHLTATDGKPPVSGSIKKLDHYCRRRDCQFHNGIKDECVLCSHTRADVKSDKDGMLRCFSYCRYQLNSNNMKELVKIQSELKAPKGQYNDFGKYKYRSAEDILEAVKPLLNETNCVLTLTDDIILIGNRFYVKAVATLTNSEGASVSVSALAREDESKKGMDGAQITGSASSYARKYAMNGLFCIDDTKDPDATNDHGKAVKTLEQVMSEAHKITDANVAREMCKASEYKAYHQELINYFKEKFHETK